MTRQVFIIGFMGAGKSTVGRIVAERLDRAFVDSDDLVEISAGTTVKQIFETEGEDGFRDRETAALASVADWPGVVVACGGGVVVRDENRRLLKDLGIVVYLKVSAGEAIARVGDDDSRPLLAGGGVAMAGTLLAAREALYAAVADITIETDGHPPEKIADWAVDALKEQGAV